LAEQERVAGGPLGKVVGKADEMAGTALGRDDLQRKGRLQEAQGDVEEEAVATEREAQRLAEAAAEAKKARKNGDGV
jgi:uncharacterized protein YjbJ (UPF0337 family)